ncbi:MAG: serine/threonine-protein kinase [Pirellulaceae bacterium]
MNPSNKNPLEIQVDHALAEYMSECDSGVIPDRQAFLARQPQELQEQLRELLSAADWIEQLAGPTLADAVGGPDASGAVPDLEETLPHANHSAAVERTLPLSFGSLEFSAIGTSPCTPRGEVSSSPPARELSQPVLPCQFGDYILQRVLGRGGMGVVYSGHQRHLDRPVAIKMIRSGALASPEEVQRFYAEARSAAKLDHPNIVTVYQCGEFEGHHYFSMDYVAGTDLARMTKDQPLDGKRAARYVRDVARAIQYAHDRGVLHRDLKPANVLVDSNDMVRITDFGLAKQIGMETGLTATGAALGTPGYMSPEQASGRADEQHHATDIYSLGAILFTIVTGRAPFKASGVLQTIMQVIHRPPPMARSINPEVDQDLETIIDVCLQKAPERRYPSATALAAELDRYLNGVPIQSRPMSQLRRCWYWLLGVPIFGAILDHRVVEPTDAHRWVQRGLIASALLILCAWMLLLIPSSLWYKNRIMPRSIRVAAGVSGGSYDQVAHQLVEALGNVTNSQSSVLTTEGSSDNLGLLLDHQAELALLQGDSVGSSSVAVIAPLYYETVHIIVRAASDIDELSDVVGKQIMIGADRAGSRGVAQLLLERAGISLPEVEIVNADWRELNERPTVQAAIVVSRLRAPELVRLLNDGQYRLLAVPDAIEFALDEPVFHPQKIPPSVYPNCQLPEMGIATVAPTAYLATQIDTSDALVKKVLECLYAPEMIERTGILPADRAAHWQGLVWHPAAREFFQPYRDAASGK